MVRKNHFWRGIFLGAIAGGTISLLDKETRRSMKEGIQAASKALKNPGEITQKVKGSAVKLKTTVGQMSEDIQYIVEKVDELKELTPQVTGIIKETKEAFAPSEGEGLMGISKSDK